MFWPPMFSIVAAVAALALDSLFGAPTLAGAHAGAVVIDAQTGDVLYARNANDAFIPASTMKLIVGSAALDILGDAFNFTTTLSTDGTNLYLVGGGDSLLSVHDVEEAATVVRATGVAYGAFFGDPSRYKGAPYPDGWQVDDLPYDYAAQASALSFSHNTLTIHVHAGASPDTPPTIDVTPPMMSPLIVNRANTGAPGSIDTTDVSIYWPQPAHLAVTGLIPVDAKDTSEIDAAALDPAGLTLSVFGEAFGIRGQIGQADYRNRVIWQHHSIELPGLLGAMWKPSDNLLAETLLEEIGVASPGTDDTRARGITRESGWLKGIGIDPKTVTIADGSGMSSYDRVTPHALSTILSHDWFSSHRQTMLDDLPVAGASGTLQHLFTEAPLAGNVFAKTGTSNHTRTLAGYVMTPAGMRIFALMVNDWMDSGPGSADRLHAFQAAFLRAIASGKAPAALH
jgi:D-alanyl-D-alanine carboxypeptidase/D-alanyl-D-alanine-endopeptidase (penicillin-binding protein 4)